jgi:hypothetical protein
VTRIVVLGGRGFFGAAAVDLLRRDGVHPVIASRRPGADLRIDVEDAGSLRAALQAGDVVIDAAGPFQPRSTALAEACLERRCDLIDLSDSLEYTRRVQQLASAIGSTRSRLLPACSSVSAVSAALVRLSGVRDPVRVSAFLAPATRNTSTPATAASLLSALAGPVRLRRGGELVERRAFGEERFFAFPAPLGRVRARLGESPDAVTLPLVWPGLRDVDFWIDTRRRALNVLFAAAARARSVRALVRAAAPIGRRLTKRFGPRSGGFGIEVEEPGGRRVAMGFVHASHSYLVAVAPAVLAAEALAAGASFPVGLVPVDRYVEPLQLIEYLRRMGVQAFPPAPSPQGRHPDVAGS